MNNPLTIDELVNAFVILGGVATWTEVYNHIETARHHSHEPYKDKMNFVTTLRQLLYRRCPGFAKYNGDPLFHEVGPSRFRLLNFNPLLERRPWPEAGQVEDWEAVVRRSREVSEFNRDQRLVARVKALYDSQCQVCGIRLRLPSGEAYAEAHHVKGLAEGGPDSLENMICTCANCHALLDLKVIELRMELLHARAAGHALNAEHFDLHNTRHRERWNPGGDAA
ncbi:MAG: HNH endonuclease [Gemmataceae bacterium]|nr:HNH endonuclease [Gemmataceae bacterium]